MASLRSAFGGNRRGAFFINGQWTMDNGQWTMDNGQWTMHNGQ